MGSARPGSVNRSSEFRGDDDNYSTPDEAIRPFLEASPLRDTIWEPACGSGALAKAMNAHGYTVFPSTLVDYGYGATGLDFLHQQNLPSENIRSIVTNPPFNLANEFILHSLKFQVPIVAIFARLKLLEGRKRYNILFRHKKPSKIYVFIERIKFFADNTPREEQPGWNTEAFAWFVWENLYEGDPRVFWLERGGSASHQGALL